MKKEIELSEMLYLNLEQAALYTNIGINRLREITNSDDFTGVLWIGAKRLIHRKTLETYLEALHSN